MTVLAMTPDYEAKAARAPLGSLAHVSQQNRDARPCGERFHQDAHKGGMPRKTEEISLPFLQCLSHHTHTGRIDMKRLKKNYAMLAFVAVMAAALSAAGCSSTGQATIPGTSVNLQSPVTTQMPVLTAQQVISYVQPWLQVAEGLAAVAIPVAAAVSGAGAGGTGLADTVKIAQAALAAFQTTPSTVTLNALNTAMAPVYTQAKAANTVAAN